MRIDDFVADNAILTSLACKQLLARLGEAVELAVGDLPPNLGRFREILSDLVYRVDAIELVNSLDRTRAEQAA